VSQSIDILWSFPGAWSGHNEFGDFEAFWGDLSAHSGLRAKFDRLIDRAVGPVGFDERYLSHSQEVSPATVPHHDLVSHGGYGARPKMAGSARQKESVWAGAGPMELQPSSGIPLPDSSATETGYGQPAYLGQPRQSSQAHTYPPYRIDRSAEAVSASYSEQSTGYWVQAPSSASGPSSFNPTTDGRVGGFTAEARGMRPPTKRVDVTHCAVGASRPPLAQLSQGITASMGAKPKHPLLMLQCYDGSESLYTFLLKFHLMASYLQWNDEDKFSHLCASVDWTNRPDRFCGSCCRMH